MAIRWDLLFAQASLVAALLAPRAGIGAVTVAGDTFIDSGSQTLQVGINAVGSASVVAPGPDVFSFIGLGGNLATGATGTITVSGAGAALTATNAFNVGGLSVGTLLIQNGAVVNAQGGASPFPNCLTCNGTEIGNGAGSTGTLTVTGAGSRFIVGDSLGTNSAFGIANGGVSPGFGTPGAPTSATFNVLNGATATTVGAFVAFSNLGDPTSSNGQSASTGIVNVDGTGSTWTVQNTSVGLPSTVLAGYRGTGIVNITNGGRINSTFMPVGWNPGSSGTLRVEGSQSLLNMVGGDPTNGAAGIVIGWLNGATGSVSVLNGGRILIDGRDAGTPGGGITIGGNGGFGTGTMTVSGTGSLVQIIGNGTNVDGRAPGFTVGGTGSGQLSVLNGGKITVEDTSALATGAFAIGGSPFQQGDGTPAGTGTMVVSGAGSEVDVLSTHGAFVVGRGGVGTLIVDNGGKVSAQSALIGFQPGSVGTMVLRGATSTVALAGVDNAGFGAFVSVGLGGNGTLNVSDGATLSINPAAGVPFGGLVAGGAGTQSATDVSGTGVINVANNGKIQITGNNSLAIVLGDHNGGNGQLNITAGGQVVVGQPLNANAPGDISGVYVGSRVGGNGIAVVRGTNSLLNGGAFVGVGIATDRVTNAGTGTLTVRDGGVVQADQIRIGDGGLLNGNGTVIGAVVNAGGIIAPGNSPGTLTIQGSLQSHGLIEIQVAGLRPGQFDVLNVLGSAVLAGSKIEFIFENGFLPKTGDSFDFLSGTTNPVPLAGAIYDYTGAGPGFEFDVDAQTGVFLALNDASPPVPEPETYALFGTGLAVLMLLRARRLNRPWKKESRTAK